MQSILARQKCLKIIIKNIRVIVTDIADTTIKVITINNKTGNITFDASLLSAGMHHYALITGDNIVTTKTFFINEYRVIKPP